MSREIEDFYRQRYWECDKFEEMLNLHLLNIGRVTGYVGKEWPEKMLREIVDKACDDIRADLLKDNVFIPDEDYRLIKEWVMEMRFGKTKKQWTKLR